MKTAKKKSNILSKIDIFILFILLVIGISFRLYRINAPLADWHSWRQADTAAVARNFIKDGFSLLTPRYDDLSNIQSGDYNPEGYRFVEFPFYNSIFAVSYKYLPVFTLATHGRVVSIVFSLILISTLYVLSLKLDGRVSAFFTGFIFSVFPFFVYYSRAVIPEMTAVSLMFLSILFLYLTKDPKTTRLKNIVLFSFSSIFAALAILTKPTTIFYLLAHFAIFIIKYKKSIFRQLSVYIYFAVSIIPLFLWRMWILNFPEGIPYSAWLFTSVNTPEGMKSIFFRPSFFRWVFHERILNLILGGYVGLFLLMGLLRQKIHKPLIPAIGLSALLFLFVFQGGNVQHDYYQVIILPALALFVGSGASFFLTYSKKLPQKLASAGLILVLFAFSFYISYFKVKDYYNINRGVVDIANIVDTITEKQALIVTDTLGDTTLLYLSKRKGFPNPTDTLENLKKRGAQYFVTTDSTYKQKLENIYDLVFSNDQVFIFKL